MTGPLAGTRVVEFAAIGPVPLAGMLLADLGAEVTVIERPSASSVAEWVPREHLVTNRGKRLTAADLKNPDDRAKVTELVRSADAILEGLRPGVMERLDLGPAELLAANPRLVYVRVTGWGQTGERARTAGHDISYLAVTGALAMIGRESQAPVPPINFLGDYAGGTMFAVTGLLAGLLEARSSGKGQVVDVAMVDGVGALLAPTYGMLAAGRWRLERGSNLLDTGAPFYDVYRAADGGYLAVGALEDEFFAVLAERLELPPEVTARRWDPSTWAALRVAIAERIARQPRDHWAAVFRETDACVAPVLDVREATDDGHARSRQGHTTIGGTVQPAGAPRFSRTPGRAPAAPPTRRMPLDEAVAMWRRY
ncbi:MAG: CoA transferase [Gemmatimonadetes bacterium]|nr:CoA transferase [Gemmatimonadota bacterium]